MIYLVKGRKITMRETEKEFLAAEMIDTRDIIVDYKKAFYEIKQQLMDSSLNDIQKIMIAGLFNNARQNNIIGKE